VVVCLELVELLEEDDDCDLLVGVVVRVEDDEPDRLFEDVEENDVPDLDWVIPVVTVICDPEDVVDTDAEFCEVLVEEVEPENVPFEVVAVAGMFVPDRVPVERVELDSEIVVVIFPDELPLAVATLAGEALPVAVEEVFVGEGVPLDEVKSAEVLAGCAEFETVEEDTAVPEGLVVSKLLVAVLPVDSVEPETSVVVSTMPEEAVP